MSQIPSQRVRLALQLSRLAWQRFQARRKIEWQVNLALWTLMALMAYAILQWSPQNDWVVILCLPLLLVLLLMMNLLYATFRYACEKRNWADQGTSHYWETCARSLGQLGNLPARFGPLPREWVDYETATGNEQEMKCRPHPEVLGWRRVHMWILITLFFSCLPLFALLLKIGEKWL